MGRALAAVVSIGLVVLGTAQVLDVAAMTTRTERTVYEGIRHVDVDDAGTVTITGGPPGTPVQLTTRITESLRSPGRRVVREGDTLRVDSSCPVVFASSCSIDYELVVPPGVGVRADASAGDVLARDLRSTSRVVLRSSAGEVEAHRVTAPELDASSSAGGVRLLDVRAGSIRARSSAGDVRVEALGAFAELSAESSAGDVGVLVPDLVYDLDAGTTAGDTEVRSVRTDPDAPRRLRLTSSAGDVRVEVR